HAMRRSGSSDWARRTRWRSAVSTGPSSAAASASTPPRSPRHAAGHGVPLAKGVRELAGEDDLRHDLYRAGREHDEGPAYLARRHSAETGRADPDLAPERSGAARSPNADRTGRGIWPVFRDERSWLRRASHHRKLLRLRHPEFVQSVQSSDRLAQHP